MRYWAWGCWALGVYGFFGPGLPMPNREVLLIYGDAAGQLSPCGCTSPMTGGIQRLGTLVREFQREDPGRIAFAVSGGDVANAGKQSEYKSECLAETAGALNAAAIEFSPDEAELGPGVAAEDNRLCGEKLINTSLAQPNKEEIGSLASNGDFLFGAVSKRPELVGAPLGESTVSESESMQALADAAKSRNEVLVVFYDGTEQEARELAKEYPDIGVLVYRSTSDPPNEPIRAGGTLLVTPGFHGKDVVALFFEGGLETSYRAIPLGPDIAADREISGIYNSYLKRVNRANLLYGFARFRTGLYAGSQSCRNCHTSAYSIWHSSAHFRSYKDLVSRLHTLDPDCVRCHVVGLSSVYGFRSREQTPGLAAVGCESCHGPALGHARGPKANRLPKVGQETCISCHTLDNSPNFDFSVYWPKVKH